MEKQFDDEDDAARRERWAQRRREMKRQKQRQAMIRKIARIAVPAVAAVLVLAVALSLALRRGKKTENDSIPAAGQDSLADVRLQDHVEEESERQNTGSEDSEKDDADGQTEDTERAGVYQFSVTDSTEQLGGDVSSDYAILVDSKKGSILARKAETTRIVPASMTKVLTLLVAVENIAADKLDEKFEITTEITDYSFVNDCTVAGFEKGEKVTIRDLLYGTILPSGADGALGLAIYVSGSQEAFVDLMNDKLEELGLSESAHFTNCVGIYDADHYCTVYDMAVIMQAAVENKICREVMSAHTYTTSVTEKHPEGIELSNWFLRRIEDKDSGGEVICGKSGYVVQSKNCAVSYQTDSKGREYICVTASAPGLWRCIYDHVNIYKKFSELG